jgi:hypothetical protein
VLALLIVGALPIGFGHTIRTGLSWYVFHKDDLTAVITDSWAVLGTVAATVALGHAVWRRNWGRALEWLWAALGLWSLTTAVAGGWALVSAHQRWWAYPWFVGWGGVGFAFLILAANAGEAADRKQKRQDRLREREDARRLAAENARPRRDGLARLRARETPEAGTGPAAGMTQTGSGASADPPSGQPGDVDR